LTAGDVVIAAFPGAHVIKTRPAVVLSSAHYSRHRPDIILGLVTTTPVHPPCPTDHEIRDWRGAGLHAPSSFRLYLVTLRQRDVRVIGRLANDDWREVRQRVQLGLIGV
jgi:mRNA-degrading endonuclease toxin of MazEF toxin-antitoxin module